jgi:hypothetical protein
MKRDSALRVRPFDAAIDLAETGYPAVRNAFNRVLNACVALLAEKDIRTACDVLGIKGLGKDAHALVMETALYSRPGNPVARTRRKRAIDRLASKVRTLNSLDAAIAERLPDGFFSIFQVEDHAGGGIVHLKDLIDGNRRVGMRDDTLSKGGAEGKIIATRLLDLGPWHIGFGNVLVVRRSEAAAILFALSYEGDVSEKRDALHELVYGCWITDDNLVMEALTPLISAIALSIDESEADISELVAQMRTFEAEAA